MADVTNREIAIQLSGVKKMYKLGQIGGGTLQADLQSWWARVRGKDDPNTKIDADQRLIGKTFMALNGVDLTIYKGEALGIIGSNGAGKSTMLKLLSRVTAPTEGTIDIYGRIASMLEVGTGFNGEMTGRENVYMNGAILGMTKKEIDAKMEQIIEFSEVRDFIDTPVKRYSSGMFVKLAFSVAAHLDSEIMIMDEILAVGDMAFQKKCLTKMREAANQEGRTVLYVSHNMSTIRQLCSRCIVLDKGKIIFDGDVEKAILVYNGNNYDSLPVYYDLDSVSRPYKQHGKRIHLISFEFVEKKIASFDQGELIHFTTNFISHESIYDLKLYIVIYTINGERIGMVQTISGIVNTKKDKEYTCCFCMDTSILSPGKYYFEVDYFSDDGEGNHWSYDHPSKNIFFEIKDTPNKRLRWDHQQYGNICFSPIIVEGVKD